MDRDTGSNITGVAIIAQNIIEVTGDHGENGMIIEDIIIVHTEKVTITDKVEVFTSSLKMKTGLLYSQLEDNYL